MIDWVNAILPFPHANLVHGGAVQFITAEGEISGTTLKKAIARGSYDSKVALKSSYNHMATDWENGEVEEEGGVPNARCTHIWISGSPKFLQGHNLFGTSDPRELAAMLARKALAKFGYKVDPWTYKRWLAGDDVTFTRIDVTEMLDVGNETNAAQWMMAAADQGRCKFRGRGKEDHGTIYYGKQSRRWALKLYRKYVEISSRSKQHALPQEITQREELMRYAEGTVRSELVLQSLELKRQGLKNGTAWKDRDALAVWKSFMDKLELTGNIPLKGNVIERLPRGLRSTYALWNSGADMRGVLGRSQLYANRRELLKHGIDIFTKPNRENTVIPLVRVIEARPKGVPSWAIGTSLYARAA